MQGFRRLAVIVKRMCPGSGDEPQTQLVGRRVLGVRLRLVAEALGSLRSQSLRGCRHLGVVGVVLKPIVFAKDTAVLRNCDAHVTVGFPRCLLLVVLELHIEGLGEGRDERRHPPCIVVPPTSVHVSAVAKGHGSCGSFPSTGVEGVVHVGGDVGAHGAGSGCWYKDFTI